jgi:hypothetical protein
MVTYPSELFQVTGADHSGRYHSSDMQWKTLMKRPVWILLVILTGCGQRIPNVVTPQEYEVYSAWMKYRYPKQPDGALYLASETFIQQLDNCEKELKLKGVDSLRRQLLDLGAAKYPLRLHSKTMHVPWPFEEADDFPPKQIPYGELRYVQFSRVAFNRQRSEALFTVNVGRGYHFRESGETELGLGGGGAIIATKQNGVWIVTDTRCIWIE